jgi:acyl-CoA reductase-like NAD-dependent aldehyde dehydrogenase
MPRARLSILKTFKLFIGGKFPRTESGRTLTAVNPATGEHLAHYCRASKKDARDAVVAARAAQTGWAAATPYLRGQILYRAAEMIESRGPALAEAVTASTGIARTAARREVAAAADRWVHFAGWTDKVAAVFGSVNPVATPHFNFTSPEPTGVVGVICPDAPSLLGVVGAMAPVLATGNTVVVVASEQFPLPAMELAEALATSDLPAGTINILTGQRAELAQALAGHLDVNAVVDASGDAALRRLLREGAGTNLKRIHFRIPTRLEPEAVLDTVEMKTVWHPVGY